MINKAGRMQNMAVGGKLARKKRRKENLIGYSFVSFSIIGFMAFMAFPMLYSLYISFMDWNMFVPEKSQFIGWKNYLNVFQNEYFVRGFWNNVILAVMAVPGLLFLSLLVATLLNQKIYAQGALRVVYFLPYIAITTAAALVFSALFHPEFGPINGILKAIGIENTPGWATSTQWALPTIAIFTIWKNVGYCIIIYLAALQGVSQSYYEAASIDGASKFQLFFRITIPLVSPTTFFLLITNIIHSFKMFEEVQILTAGGPGTSSYTMVFHIYQSAFQEFKMGFAAAEAWVYFGVVLVVTAFQFWGEKKWVKY